MPHPPLARRCMTVRSSYSPQLPWAADLARRPPLSRRDLLSLVGIASFETGPNFLRFTLFSLSLSGSCAVPQPPAPPDSLCPAPCYTPPPHPSAPCRSPFVFLCPPPHTPSPLPPPGRAQHLAAAPPPTPPSYKKSIFRRHPLLLPVVRSRRPFLLLESPPLHRHPLFPLSPLVIRTAPFPTPLLSPVSA